MDFEYKVGSGIDENGNFILRTAAEGEEERVYKNQGEAYDLVRERRSWWRGINWVAKGLEIGSISAGVANTGLDYLANHRVEGWWIVGGAVFTGLGFIVDRLNGDGEQLETEYQHLHDLVTNPPTPLRI